MNVQEFQNKLKEVQEIARQHGNALNAAEIRPVSYTHLTLPTIRLV